jgi:hypothetical protein
MPGSKSEIRGKFCNDLGSSIVVQFLLFPLLPFMTELLQGSMWTGRVISCFPWSRRYFRTMMQFSKMTMSPFTHLEQYSHDSKSMKVNLNIFAGKHSQQIWISLNRSGQFWRLEWGTDSHLQYLKQLEDILKEKWYKIPLQTVQNLYDPIPCRTAAVLKAKGYPTPY